MVINNMSVQQKVGVLIVNLGSPSALTTQAIRAFLREFLMDKYVIDLPWLARAMIVYGLVLPFRPKRLIPQYEEIWLREGSPLTVYTQSMANKLAVQLGDQAVVRMAMRYGQPNIGVALAELMQHDLEQLIVIPMYPQYAMSTTGSTLAELYLQMKRFSSCPPVTVIPDYYNDPDYIAIKAAVCRPVLEQYKPDHVLMSYHGLPVSHLEKDETHTDEVCHDHRPCPEVGEGNAKCYRAQCFTTSRSLAQSLGLKQDEYTTSFQSRFGKNKWIEPATDTVLPQLISNGVKRLAVTMPSFVVDCLETLEEIAIRAKQQWLDLGGESMEVIPCLNDDDRWVDVMAQWVRQKALTGLGGSCNVTKVREVS